MNFAAVKLIERYQWTRLALLYDDNFSLRSLQPLLDVTATAGGAFRIVTKQLTNINPEGYR